MRRPGVRLSNSVGHQVARPAISLRIQRRNALATVIAYDRFCHLNSSYHHSMSNQMRIFDWIDERRIEMLAEGRPHWVPSERDFEQAMRDCWDDFVKP
jgi:hypothetical protein